MHKKAVTTLNRAATQASALHDVLFFRGSSVPAAMKPADVVMPPVNPAPRSLYEAAENAEKALTTKPIEVTAPANEGVVAAVYSRGAGPRGARLLQRLSSDSGRGAMV